MNVVLVDTSAVMALLVPTDLQHAKARRAFTRLGESEARLLITSYALVECYALIGRRIGLDAVRRFRADFEPLFDIAWIGADQHERGLDQVEAGAASGPSLVDAVSFVVARDRDIEHVFAYDTHFTKAGFVSVG